MTGVSSLPIGEKNFMKTFLSSELSKKLNGYEFVNTKDKQVNI